MHVKQCKKRVHNPKERRKYSKNHCEVITMTSTCDPAEIPRKVKCCIAHAMIKILTRTGKYLDD